MFKFIKLILTVLVSVYFASLIYVLSFAWKVNIPAHADAILVLGAKVNLDNSPSQPLYNRSLQASNLFKAGKADYLITTGGQGLGATPESTVSGEIAQNNGVPQNKIISEEQSHNTFENVEDVTALAHKYLIKSVIVVSDRFHIARGVFVAKQFGFNPVYWDYPDDGYYKTSDLIRNYAREAAAMIYYVPKAFLFKTQLLNSSGF
jgi:uncharacterized SAM-binding protein YcdF (DUF218 family)